jgi:hypothetical protein
LTGIAAHNQHAASTDFIAGLSGPDMIFPLFRLKTDREPDLQQAPPADANCIISSLLPSMPYNLATQYHRLSSNNLPPGSAIHRGKLICKIQKQ